MSAAKSSWRVLYHLEEENSAHRVITELLKMFTFETPLSNNQVITSFNFPSCTILTSQSHRSWEAERSKTSSLVD